MASSASSDDLSRAERIERILQGLMPWLAPEAVRTFAAEHHNDTFHQLTAEVERFFDTAMPEIPHISKGGYRLHLRTPSRTFNEDDPAEKHIRAAEGVLIETQVEHNGATVKAVDYVENDELKHNFMAKKNQMAACGIDPAELLLFHGTPEENLDAILSGNFDPSRIARVAHGHGFYFSEFPAFSMHYGRSLILCRVLPGRIQTVGSQLDAERFDSLQVAERGPSTEGQSFMQHVVKHRDQILPFCVVHTTATTWQPRSDTYKIHRTTSFDIFDEEDAAKMHARAAHSLFYRMTVDKLLAPESVVYVENAEVKTEFLDIKDYFEEIGTDTKEVLLLHGPVRSLSRNFFSNNEFDADLLLSDDDAPTDDDDDPSYVLSDWVDKERPDYLRVYVVYRVLLGRIQMSDSGPFDTSEFDSYCRPSSVALPLGARNEYVVRCKGQILPYCVAVVKGMYILNFLKLFEPFALARELSSPSTSRPAGPTCSVCKRSDLPVMGWYGGRMSCALCADFFKRVCTGSAIFAHPEECKTGFSCTSVVMCGACRLKCCLEANMTHTSLLAHSGQPKEREAEIARHLGIFSSKVLAAAAKRVEEELNKNQEKSPSSSSVSSLSEDE